LVGRDGPFWGVEPPQYVNPIGLASLAWKFYLVYIAILVIEVACIWFLFVETQGPTLEEIAVLLNGKDAKVAQKALADEDKFEETLEEAVAKMAGAV
jgi:hypothetical protein